MDYEKCGICELVMSMCVCKAPVLLDSKGNPQKSLLVVDDSDTFRFAVEQIDHPMDCDMCNECREQFTNHLNNPYGLYSKVHQSNIINELELRALLTAKPGFSWSDYGEVSITEPEIDFSYDCDNKGCLVGFVISVHNGFFPSPTEIKGGIIELKWWF